MEIELYLPYPPTVNNYYVKTSRGIFISMKGKKFREQVLEAVHQQTGSLMLADKLLVEVVIFPPTRRKCDLDNFQKALLDALTKAGMWGDDSQVDQLHIYRGAVVSGGSCFVRIGEAGPVIPEGMTC